LIPSVKEVRDYQKIIMFAQKSMFEPEILNRMKPFGGRLEEEKQEEKQDDRLTFNDGDDLINYTMLVMHNLAPHITLNSTKAWSLGLKLRILDFIKILRVYEHQKIKHLLDISDMNMLCQIYDDLHFLHLQFKKMGQEHSEKKDQCDRHMAELRNLYTLIRKYHAHINNTTFGVPFKYPHNINICDEMLTEEVISVVQHTGLRYNEYLGGLSKIVYIYDRFLYIDFIIGRTSYPAIETREHQTMLQYVLPFVEKGEEKQGKYFDTPWDVFTVSYRDKKQQRTIHETIYIQRLVQAEITIKQVGNYTRFIIPLDKAHNFNYRSRVWTEDDLPIEKID
jgi:hypothetical protein